MSDQVNQSGISKEERQWATFTHLASFAGLVIPLGNLLGPLALWLVKREAMPFVDDQGKEAINFAITMTIAITVAVISLFFLIGLLLLPAVLLVDVIFTVIASMKANEGVQYRYPLSIRFIK